MRQTCQQKAMAVHLTLHIDATGWADADADACCSLWSYRQVRIIATGTCAPKP